MWNSRIRLTAAISGLIAIVSGAFITSAKVALAQGQPEPNAGVHRAIALLAIGLLAAGIIAQRSAGTERTAVWAALVCVAASAMIGWNHPLSHGAAVWHAAFSHLFTASITVALVMAAPSWNRPSTPLATSAWRALRPAAIATPAAVFGQIVMGALYRHEVAGVLPHMLGAMIVALVAMVVSAVILQDFSESVELKRAATFLISAVLTQVCLGIAVFVMLLLNASDTPAFIWIATAHVATGTVVLAASVVMAMMAWRHLSPGESAR